jgi:hypothetical protein
MPGLNDDVVDRSVEDYKKAQKGRNADSSKVTGNAREMVKEAGKRAANRNVGRAGLAGAALQAGYEGGRMLDEQTGLGKKIVGGSGLGRVADKMGASDRVKLSEAAKERLDDMASDKALREVDAEREASKYGKGDEGMKRGGKVKAYANGGSVSASSRADGIASKGKTRGRMC